jgi:hypothetical protein
MTSQQWQGDEELVADLAKATRAAPVPEQVLRAARAAFERQRQQAAHVLAKLGYDSVLEDEFAVRAEDSGDRRVVTFDSETLSVEIEVSANRLIGQLVPPMEAEVELVSATATIGHTTADGMGCFALDRPPRGPVQIRCRVPAGLVLTDWVLL